jgi:hypothetical protein
MASAFPVIKLDVSGLAEKLQDDSLFDLYDWRKEKYAHREMKDIWVRYNHISNIGEKFNDSHESVWYPIIEKIPEVLPIVFNLMAYVNGERLGGVLITKVPSGGKIAKHVDGGWHAGYYEKFYVPIQNGKGSKFCWDDLEIEPEAGEVWQFDNSIPHWVENDSDKDRMAMIVCIKTLARSLNEH